MEALPPEEVKQIYIRAISTWGEESQLNMAIEEMAELIQAINKLRRAPMLRIFLLSLFLLY